MLCKGYESSDKTKLERIQERAPSVIYKSHSATYEELLRRADIPSLYNRRLQDITALVQSQTWSRT